MENTKKTKIKYALIQSGYCVFGVGATREECLIDASHWLEADENGAFTPERIENELLKPGRNVDGDFYVIDNNNSEFDDYLENQGGFEKIDGEWVAK